MIGGTPDEPRERGPRPFRGRIIGGGPGSPPVVEVVIELAPGQPGGKVSAMRLRIPFRQAERLQAQLAGAITKAYAQGLVPPGMTD